MVTRAAAETVFVDLRCAGPRHGRFVDCQQGIKTGWFCFHVVLHPSTWCGRYEVTTR